MRHRKTSITILDYVNIALAALSWVLPNIDTSIKVVMTLVLLGIAVLARSNESFFESGIGYGFFVLIILLMAYLQSICMSYYVSSSFLIGQMRQDQLLQGSFVYGLVVGLPLAFISRMASNQDIRFGVVSFFGVAALFLLIAFVSVVDHFAKTDFLSPIQYTMSIIPVIHLVNTYNGIGKPRLDGFATLLFVWFGLWLQNTLFEFLGWVSSLDE
jgi:hypothetical protein